MVFANICELMTPLLAGPSRGEIVAAFIVTGWGSPAIQSLLENRFVDVNDAFLAMTGFRRAELIGRTPMELRLCIDYQTPPLGEEKSLRHVEAQVSTKTGDLRRTRTRLQRPRRPRSKPQALEPIR